MNDPKIILAASPVRLTVNEFWGAVMLYHNRPHLANRKLLAASQVLFCKVCIPSQDDSEITKLFTNSSVLNEVAKLDGIRKENITVDFIKNILDCHNTNWKLSESSDGLFNEESQGVFISVRILLARNKACGECVEVVILSKTNNRATFLAVTELNKSTCNPTFPYEIELSDTFNLRIKVNSVEDAEAVISNWLSGQLFPNLLKWAKQGAQVPNQTLSCVAVDEYGIVYNKMKQSYAEDLIKKWPSKTTSDLQKCVYEDLAIASYLICIWKQNDKKDINFVDCACGNGLLVYLLNQEGYKGYGIDTRKRPIWEIYSESTILQVDTVTPDTKFPNSNWIIGSHSNELSPWIPVLALKNSLDYFLLPCDPYDLSGRKYVRKNYSFSQYEEFLCYIENISKKCGFETKVDRLRIPSTRKVCLIGFATNITPESRPLLIKEIDEYIETNSKNRLVATEKVKHVPNFTPQNKSPLNDIVNEIVQLLLQSKNYIQKSNGDNWNKGTWLRISDICQGLSRENSKLLKRRFGGINSLLRKQRYLFKYDKGNVKLRLPFHVNDVGERYKNKRCWYVQNHENGCFLTAEDCAYLH